MSATHSSVPSLLTVEVRIAGRVQGVWYRGWTVEQAQARGLLGWVRNRRDGSVEALFQGPAATVEDMLRACHQGPPAARVAAVEATAVAPPDPNPRGFRQLATI